MARVKGSYPFPEINSKLPFQESKQAQDEAFEKIPKDRILSTGVADGYAYYYVESFNPVVLQHIPYGDAWHADPIWIKGLSQKDVQSLIKIQQSLDELFS